MILMHRLVRSLPRRRLPLARQAVLAVACIAVAAATRQLLDPVLDDGPFLTFFPAVLVASVWGGVGGGALTLLLGAATAAFFWVAPEWTLAVSKLGATTLLAFLIAGSVIIFCAHLLHTAAAMARESEERAGLIAGEMQHRLLNDLTMVESIARLSARSAASVDEFTRDFGARLGALAAAQRATRRAGDLPAELSHLLRSVLRPFDEQRIAFSGPAVGVDGRDRAMVSLLVHELATNAVKHGALSVPDGRVSITWSVDERGVTVDWLERGGPRVAGPGIAGFGTELTRSAIARDRGRVALAYEPEGVRCTVTLFAGARGAAAKAAGPVPTRRFVPFGN